MKHNILRALIICSFFTFGLISSGKPLVLSKEILRVGDVVLQPLDCHSCEVIGDEGGSKYSHALIVIQTKPVVRLAEALGEVKSISLADLNSRRLIKGEENVVLRHSELEKLFDKTGGNMATFSRLLLLRYEVGFEGHPYDHDFLWFNKDVEGREKYYCSEFVTKLLNVFLLNRVPVAPMDYSKNWDFWTKYFGHEPPQGKVGNSPSTFYNSPYFSKVWPL